MIEEKKQRRNRLIRLIAIVIIAGILIIIGIQVYMGNVLTATLIRSLGTFDVNSVSYPSVQPDEVELNITFTLKNSGSFRLVIEKIDITFFIESTDIGGVSYSEPQELLPGETKVFWAWHPVQGSLILDILERNSYELRVVGTITGYSSFLFIESRQRKQVNVSENVEGLS